MEISFGIISLKKSKISAIQIVILIATGEPESAYRYDALNRYPMSDVLRPFELAAGMCRMHWLSPIIIYWARRQSAQELASHARAYGDWLANPLSPGGR